MITISAIHTTIFFGALIIGAFSCYLVYSRTTTAYPAVRRVLVVAFIVGLCRISLESLKVLTNFHQTALVYDLATNILEQIFVILLVLTSIGIYLKSTDTGIRNLLKRIWQRRGISVIILVIIGYCAFVSSYIAIERPYTVEVAKDLFGASITTMFFPQTFLDLIAPNVMIIMVGVPGILFQASRKSQNKLLARNLIYLGLSSMMVGIFFLAFTVYQNTAKVDPEGVLYFLLSIMFSSAALSFNKASVYAGFLDRPAVSSDPRLGTSQFSKSLKKSHDEIVGNQFLVEVDVNAPYEKTVTDFCLEFVSCGDSVLVVTPKSSVLQRALGEYKDIRFCLFSSTVSRPTLVEEEAGQILIPQDSLTDVVDVLETIWTQSKENRGTALVLDNLSDRVISIGLERTYKYLKEILAILGERKTTCFFLMHSGTMDTQGQSLLRSLFGNILVVSRDRLTILKE